MINVQSPCQYTLTVEGFLSMNLVTGKQLLNYCTTVSAMDRFLDIDPVNVRVNNECKMFGKKPFRIWMNSTIIHIA